MSIRRIEHTETFLFFLEDDPAPEVYHVSDEHVAAPILTRSNAPTWQDREGYPVVRGLGEELTLGIVKDDELDLTGDMRPVVAQMARCYHIEDALDWIEGVRRRAAGGTVSPEPILSAWEEALAEAREDSGFEVPSEEEMLENPITAWSHADPAIHRLNERRREAGLEPISTKVTEREREKADEALWLKADLQYTIDGGQTTGPCWIGLAGEGSQAELLHAPAPVGGPNAGRVQPLAYYLQSIERRRERYNPRRFRMLLRALKPVKAEDCFEGYLGQPLGLDGSEGEDDRSGRRLGAGDPHEIWAPFLAPLSRLGVDVHIKAGCWRREDGSVAYPGKADALKSRR